MSNAVRTRLVAVLVAVTAAACLAASLPGVAGAAPAKTKPKVKVLVLGDSVGQGLALRMQRDKRVELTNAASVNCTLAGGADSLQSYKDGIVIGGKTYPVEIIVNNCVIARGEVVVLEGNYGVRIHHVISREERLRTLQ